MEQTLLEDDFTPFYTHPSRRRMTPHEVITAYATEQNTNREELEEETFALHVRLLDHAYVLEASFRSEGGDGQDGEDDEELSAVDAGEF